jgi:hypothetical protein
MSHRSRIMGLFLALDAMMLVIGLLNRPMTLVIGTVEHTHDYRHWRAERPMRYTTENKRISRSIWADP